MSSVGNVTVTVLWVAELVAASQAIRNAIDTINNEKSTNKERTSAVNEALKAAFVAMHDIIDHPENHIVVCRADRARLEPRVINVVPPAAKADKPPTP